ncbi:TetR/AcrR family transcriptional regulator [Nocardia stercoris]|uniref:TetR/AcrR family transcriptional regulator n=1 Tax=Nocardia stercoris TaxID=2483361 RepID=A0A3M2KWL0_9NOCA|nr:TetR/AcrR family transcriptional regulator [Nocardia stercoris]RMI29879.1 TetR/AcrR family transcriptional regulator [Nocardia stercoris]
MTTTRTRLTAQERITQVVCAAIHEFAETGYAATKTDDIARRAGVSQPYVIRLFGSKQQLFIAASTQSCTRMEEVFRAAHADIPPDTEPDEALRILGEAFKVLLDEREVLLMFLHGFTASSDPAIGDAVRERFGEIYRLVRELTGADANQARRFMASGMLLAVLAAMQVVGAGALPTDWAQELMDSFENDSVC